MELSTAKEVIMIDEIVNSLKCASVAKIVNANVEHVRFYIVFISHYQNVCTCRNSNQCEDGLAMVKRLKSIEGNFIVYPVFKDRSYVTEFREFEEATVEIINDALISKYNYYGVVSDLWVCEVLSVKIVFVAISCNSMYSQTLYDRCEKENIIKELTGLISDLNKSCIMLYGNLP